MVSPRWRKLLRDVTAERGRVAAMTVAVAVSLVAVGAVLGARAILTREIAVNYLGTRPASATLELPGGVDAALVEEVRRQPGIADAEAREVVLARVRVGDDWRPLLLFVVDDFEDLRLNTFRRESGEWPPPEGTVLVERSALRVLEAEPGARLRVKPPHGAAREVRMAGLVHDPGLAPAWQEREGYAYATRATLAWLGEPPVLHELRISVSEPSMDASAVEARAKALAAWLGGRGHPVSELRIPPIGRHPHQRQMESVLLLMLAFSAMALVLSAVLVASSLSAMLARQVREVGVMKTLGARTGQVVGLYAALVAGVGLVSVVLAVPLSRLGALALAEAVSRMLNFTLTSTAVPPWVHAAQAAAGLGVPLLLAALPILRAARVTVRETLERHGVSADAPRGRTAALPPPLRNALRRPTRLALTLALLAAGGAMFMTALDVRRSWERNLDKIHETRHYDVEVRFHDAEPARAAEQLRQVPGVREVESWGYAPAAFARPGEVDVVRTYPDRGHGSLAVLAPPPRTRLIGFPLLAGRWLQEGDTDAVVLNHVALAQAPGLRVGDSVLLSVDGHPTAWRLVGIVEEVGSPGVAYVTDAAFARDSGTEGRARMLRIATSTATPEARADVIRAVDAALGAAGIGVESVIPFSELRTAVGDHILILVQMLVAMAAVMATVGMLGLSSTLAVSVVERTRELGVMKTLGATPSRIVGLLVAEGLFIGVLSWGLAFVLSLPLTALVDGLVGRLGFLAPLPFVVSAGAVAGWLGLVVLVSLGAIAFPARRAARLTVLEALAST